MTGQLRVGFIGLGDIGRPMATRILEGGVPLTLWARRAASLAGFPGAVAAGTPCELAERSDVVGVCVFADRDVREVLS